MTTALYRQSRNSLYNYINFYKNSAINQSVQTIFQLYHLTSKSNQKDKNIKRKPFPKELSSNLSALPKIERPKEEKKNTEQSINYIKKNPILKYISPNNRSIILPKLKISNVSLNKNSTVNQSCKTIGRIYLSPIVKKSFEIFGINEAKVFLKDISNDFLYKNVIKIIEKQVEIQILINDIMQKDLTDSMIISLDKLEKIVRCLGPYFGFIKSLCYQEKFFAYEQLEVLLYKILKAQLIIFSCFYITINEYGISNSSLLVKLHFYKLISNVSNCLLNLYLIFCKKELETIARYSTKSNFETQFNGLYYVEYQIGHESKTNLEIIRILDKAISKCILTLKYYSNRNLKYPTIKPFGEAIDQLIKEIEKPNNFNFLVNVMYDSILYCEFPSNRISFRNSIQDEGQSNTVPFLPPLTKKHKYTLVLDMDETLIHYFLVGIKGMFFIRPYCLEFLEELKNLYEIVIFTSGTKEYADKILNCIDKNREFFKYRLYRHHTTLNGYVSVKDLSLLGRDLSKTIIIDNLKDNFKIQPDNGLFISTWRGDIFDTQLKDIGKILKDIVTYNIGDVRIMVQKIQKEIQKFKMYSNIEISSLIDS